MRHTKKGQLWNLDFMMAFIIFVFAILIFFVYMVQIREGYSPTESRLITEAKDLSDRITSNGKPSSWNEDTVYEIGIMSMDLRINATKVQMFENLKDDDYVNTKRLLGTRHDYRIQFKDGDGGIKSIGGITAIGMPGMDDEDIEGHESVVKIVRFGFYDQEIVKIVVLVW